MLYERLVRPVLFRAGGGDAEAAHEWTLRRVEALSRQPQVARILRRYFAPGGQRLARTVFGLRFPTPVGLAAGMDKDGRAMSAWPALGFGFMEIGTVTWHAQPGNPRPRLYRLPATGAVINRMGFNNQGAAALAARLRQVGPVDVPVGISLGKSKVTPVDDAVADYLASLRTLYEHGDYFAVNVSSPNTPGLRALQDAGRLSELLAALRAEVATLAGGSPRKPLLVKIAPDLTDSAVGEVLEVCVKHEVAGVIATNTTLARDGVAPADETTSTQSGGLSGAPLAARALEVVRFVRKEAGDQLPVMGVGGIGDATAALRMFDAGASLVQLYTGLVYRGPGLVRGVNRAIARQRR